MGLFSIFKRPPDAAGAAAAAEPGDAVQQARTRARRRLIGAVVLLVIGVIGFPLVFETRPRPIPIDIPIEIPRKDTAPALVMPPVRPVDRSGALPPPTAAAEVVPESRNDAGREVSGAAVPIGPGGPPRMGSLSPTPGAHMASASAAHGLEAPRLSASAAARSAVAEPVRKPLTSASGVAADAARKSAASANALPAPRKPAAASASVDGARAKALLDASSAATSDTARGAALDSTRFVVQVGAFAEAVAARETRVRAEKLGLKTYTQVAQTPTGSRIRVRIGPFVNRAEADAALAKARAAGLSAVVLTL